MSAPPASRRELVRELSRAADDATATTLARQARSLADASAARQALEDFTGLIRQGRSPVEVAAGPARAAAAIAAVDRGAFARAVRDHTAGVLAHLAGRSAEARRRLARAARRYAESGEALFEGDVQRILIDVQMFTGDDPAARAAARRSEAAYARAGRVEAWRRGALAMNLGNLHHRRDRLQEALDAYGKARRYAARAHQPLHIGIADFNRANVLSTLDRTVEARRLYERARTAFAAEDATALVAQAESALAALDLLEGQLDACIERLESVKQRQCQLGDTIGVAHADMEQAEALLRLNRSAEARVAGERARRVFRRVAFDHETGLCSGILGGAALQQGYPGRAARLFAAGRDVEARQGNRVAAATHELGLAQAELARSRPERARATAERAAATFRRAGLASREARALTLAADAARAAGRGRLAWNRATRALALAIRRRDARVQLAARMALARIERDAGDVAAAYRHLRAAERNVDRMRRGITRDESRLAFGIDKSEVYSALVANRLERGGRRAAREALKYAERGKARALAERLAESVVHLVGATAPASRRLVERVAELERRMSVAEARLEDGPEAGSGVRGVVAQLADLDRTRRATLRRLARRDPRGSALAGGIPADPERFIATLADDEIVLEYAEADGAFHLFVVDRSGVEAVPQVARVDRVRDQADLLRFQLGKGVLGDEHALRFGGQISATVEDYLATLHDWLLAPVADRLMGARVRIVPHGILHGLPFHAFHCRGVPLIEHSIISYAPSLAVLDLLERRPDDGVSSPLILGVADRSAPFIEDEVRAIRRRLPRAKVLRGANATRREVRSRGERPALMHVACHGFFSELSSWTGALRLGDAWLTLPEVYSLDRAADLVVLSGCNTGRGTVYSGDEWVGLVRGFLQAGARAVVASLWEVHDRSTVTMMDDFYANLAAGTDVATALALAQRRARQADGLPLRWAPFMVLGDSRFRPAMKRTA